MLVVAKSVVITLEINHNRATEQNGRIFPLPLTRLWYLAYATGVPHPSKMRTTRRL